jgi:AmmeMemoRadiSam system protein A
MSEHALVALARKTIETFVKDGKVIDPPADPAPEMKEKAGVFVSLHRKGDLRGCIGTFAPTTENVAKEVIRNAVESSTRDPRFPPITAGELEGLEISVDVLSEPEPVKSAKELDAKNYGVIVKSGAKKGLLLPDIPGVNTPEEQIKICRQKAWIEDDEPIELYRFRVRRFH